MIYLLRSVFGQSWTGVRPMLTTLREAYCSHRLTHGIVLGFFVLWPAYDAFALCELLYRFLPVVLPNYAWYKDRHIVGLVQRATPAVVGIRTRDHFGTGFFVCEEGLILTNAHVVGNRRNVTVVTDDDKNFKGVVQSSDARRDLAVVRILSADEKFPIIQFGDSDRIKKNDFVMVLGSLRDMRIWVATGSVIDGPRDMLLYYLCKKAWNGFLGILGIQTFSPVIYCNVPGVVPGFSGAPLIDKNGKAVGVVARAMKISRFSSCFPVSIESNVVEKFLEEVRRKN